MKLLDSYKHKFKEPYPVFEMEQDPNEMQNTLEYCLKSGRKVQDVYPKRFEIRKEDKI